MSVFRDAPVQVNPPRWLWLPFNVVLVLVLGLGAYAWLDDVLAKPAVAALMAVCAMVLVGIPYVLTLRLQLAQAQQDDLQKENETLRAREHSLQVQTHYDGLTGLANRRLVEDRFRFAVERAKRSRKSFALLTIDLNDFKSINDQYGHAAGDAVLVTIAKRLVGTIRASDTVVRLGGDKFVLIVESIGSPQELIPVNEKLFAALSDMIILETGVLVTIKANVGLALYPDDGDNLDDLVRVADQAMDSGKSFRLTLAGKKRFDWGEAWSTAAEV
jgi:diguanylate cyclase (GGDEF)-like protein